LGRSGVFCCHCCPPPGPLVVMFLLRLWVVSILWVNLLFLLTWPLPPPCAICTPPSRPRRPPYPHRMRWPLSRRRSPEDSSNTAGRPGKGPPPRPPPGWGGGRGSTRDSPAPSRQTSAAGGGGGAGPGAGRGGG